MSRLFAVVFFAGMTATSWAFPDNVPATSTTCKEMTPGHGGLVQTSTSPYTISTSASTLKSGGQLEVTIKGGQFRGFYIQARDSDEHPVGQFLSNKLTSTLSCFGKKSNAAHHVNRQPKTNLPIFWKAPPNYTGKVIFTATIVKEYTTYWTNVKSKPVDVQMATNSTDLTSSHGTVAVVRNNESRRIQKLKVKRSRIVSPKPTLFQNTSEDILYSSSFPAQATNYQVQVTDPYKTQQPGTTLQPISKFYSEPSYNNYPPPSSFSSNKRKKPLMNRLENVGVFLEPPYDEEDPTLVKQFSDTSSRKQSLGYSFNSEVPERKVNYQIQIRPSYGKIHLKQKEIESFANNNLISQFLPVSNSFPPQLHHSVGSSSFIPPKPIFGFRPNFYPFPMQNSFQNRRGVFQKSGSFHFPSTPTHFPLINENLNLNPHGGIHLPRYGYLIFNPRRGPPFYIIPSEHPFPLGLDKYPSQKSYISSVIKPRRNT